MPFVRPISQPSPLFTRMFDPMVDGAILPTQVLRYVTTYLLKFFSVHELFIF